MKTTKVFFLLALLTSVCGCLKQQPEFEYKVAKGTADSLKIAQEVVELMKKLQNEHESVKQQEMEMIEGTYSGTLTVNSYYDYPESWNKSCSAILELKSGNFYCVQNKGGGSGIFTISNDKIIFNDTCVWSCDFDHSLILNGEYNFILDGHKLKIFVDKSHAYYEWDLEKK